MHWLQGSPHPGVEPLQPLAARTNYLRGDRGDWRTAVPSFGAVAYRGVYPGVDLVFHGARGGLEYDFQLAPGADPSRIAIAFDGAKATLDDKGDLVLTAADGVLRQKRPIAYQPAGRGERRVAAAFVIEDNRVRFELGEYDRSQPLVIDPFLEYGTYLGRGDEEAIFDIAPAPDGGLIVAGYSASSDFPAVGGFDRKFDGDEDAFVAKISADGSQLEFATFFGGKDNDRANGVAMGDDGSIYIVGETRSNDLPTEANAFQRSFGGGGRDGFAARLNSTASQLIYATYLGEDDEDWANDVAVDATGAAYVVGGTMSSRFPTTAGAVQQAFGGDPDDAFVLKLQPDGRAVDYSTLLGGRDGDSATAVAVDAAGYAFVTGSTSSGNFPVSGAAFQAQRGGAKTPSSRRSAVSGRASVFPRSTAAATPTSAMPWQSIRSETSTSAASQNRAVCVWCRLVSIPSTRAPATVS